MVTAAHRRRASRRRVLHVTAVPRTAEVFLSRHFDHQRQHGWDVELACGLSEAGGAPDLGVPVHDVPLVRSIAPSLDLRGLASLIRLIRRIEPDLVHAHTPKAGLIAMAAVRLVGRRHRPVGVFHLHGLRSESLTGAEETIVRAMESLTSRLADDVLCVSHSLKTLAVDRSVIRESRSQVLGSGSIAGVDAIARFRPAPSRDPAVQDLKVRLGVPTGAMTIGFLGRLARDKRPDLLYESFRRFAESSTTDVRLLIVGDWDADDPVDPVLRRQLNDDPRVILTGWQPDPVPFLQAMQVLLSTSCREGFGVGILEAAAVEVPCIAVRATGVVDAVDDGRTGWLVDPEGAVDAIASRLALYVESPATRLAHGRAARERALSLFSPEDSQERLLSFYERVVTARSGRAR